jgi:hypothetical protein
MNNLDEYVKEQMVGDTNPLPKPANVYQRPMYSIQGYKDTIDN